MAISKSEGLNDGIDGILGMGPNIRSGPSFIKQMIDDGMIEKMVAAFSLGTVR